jgi:hypothetical protein
MLSLLVVLSLGTVAPALAGLCDFKDQADIDLFLSQPRSSASSNGISNKSCDYILQNEIQDKKCVFLKFTGKCRKQV